VSISVGPFDLQVKASTGDLPQNTEEETTAPNHKLIGRATDELIAAMINTESARCWSRWAASITK
jgi:hypothetical protein